MHSERRDYAIAQIVKSIALERKLDNAKVFDITKGALLKALTGMYGMAKLDIEFSSNWNEIKVKQCFKVVTDDIADRNSVVFDDDIEEEKQEEFDCEKNTEFNPENTQFEEEGNENINPINNSNHDSNGSDAFANLFIEQNAANDSYKNQILQNNKFEIKVHSKAPNHNHVSASIECDDGPKFHYTTIKLNDAKKIDPEATIGSIVKIDIAKIWDRLSTNNATFARVFKRVLLEGINKLLREEELKFFSKKEGTIINTIVKSFNKDGYMLTYDNYDIILPADLGKKDDRNPNKERNKSSMRPEIIPGEYFTVGDRVQVYIKLSPADSNYKYQIIASRTHLGFLHELLKQNIPEIRDGQVVIKDIKRIPGLRAKVVVFAADTSIEPVTACIGMKGIRIKGISQEMHGERIDILKYSENLEEFIKNALYPIKPIKVVNHNDEQVTIIVADDDLGAAIGKSGANVKLLSRLLGSKASITTISKFENKVMEDQKALISEFVFALDVEDIIAQLLINSGYNSIHELANVNLEELSQVEYFDLELAQEIKNRSIEYVENIRTQKLAPLDKQLIDLIKEFGYSEELLFVLVDKEIFTLSNLGDLSDEELVEILGEDYVLSCESAATLVLKARERIYFNLS